MTIEIAAIGFIVGTLVGLTGVGGGSIMTPLLVLALGINPLIAVGTDLVYSVPTKLFGAVLHARQGTIDGRVVVALASGGIPAAVAGLVLLSWLRAHADIATVEEWTRRAIGAGLIASAAIVAVTPFLRRPGALERKGLQWTRWTYVRIALIGAFVGVVVTITSIGSGSLTLPLLSLALPYVGLSELIGSDVAYAAVLIPTAAFGRWHIDVNLPLALNLLAGSIPGVVLGSALCRQLEQRWLRPAVALTLVFVGTRLI